MAEAAANGTDKLTLSKTEAAAVLGMSTRTVDRLVAGRKLRYIQVGHRRLFVRKEIDRFLSENSRLAR